MMVEKVDKKKLKRAEKRYEKMKKKIEPFIDVEPLRKNPTTGKWISSEFRHLQDSQKNKDSKSSK
ncbi:MAG: hypothetical protein ACOC38_07745 [Promethearchaeia archaeon]